MRQVLGARPRAAVRRLAALALAALTGAGCASTESVKGLADQGERDRLQVARLARATAELEAALRTELTAVRSEVEAVRAAVEGVRREAGDRQQAARDTLQALEALRARLATVEKALVTMETAVAAAVARAAAAESRAESRADGAEARLSSLGATVKGLESSVRGIETTVGGLAGHVARLEAAPPPAPAPAPAAVEAATPRPARPVAPPLTAEQLFARAMSQFRNGELGQAILDFEDFLNKHPGHALAGSAQFWIGEAYFAARDFQHAAAEYRKAVDLAPKGEKTPEALFKLGLAYLSLKRPDRARDIWTELIRDFPQSEAAQRARTTIREAPAPPRP
jgi:tol-pal system protein YbgF